MSVGFVGVQVVGAGGLNSLVNFRMFFQATLPPIRVISSTVLFSVRHGRLVLGFNRLSGFGAFRVYPVCVIVRLNVNERFGNIRAHKI